MAYFFGFFGISFLDTNAMARSPSSFGLSHLDHQLYTSRDGPGTNGGFIGAAPGGDGVSQSTMCAKETPSLGLGKSSSSNVSVSAGGRVEGAIQDLPALGPIPEGDEFSSMTDDEVRRDRKRRARRRYCAIALTYLVPITAA